MEEMTVGGGGLDWSLEGVGGEGEMLWGGDIVVSEELTIME